MNLYEAFERNLVDEAKEFPLSDTAYISLIPVGGDKARRAFERMMEPYSPRLNAGGKLTEEENKSLNVRFYAEIIIKGWRGLKDREGKEIKFSVDAAKALLSDEKLQGFFALIVRMATNDAAFEAARTEEDEGNS
jgi:hypothetical protein